MKYIIANWKAFVTTQKQAKALAQAFAKVKAEKHREIILCPPSPFLFAFGSSRAYTKGAQDVFWEKDGAYTGQTTLAMLVDAGVTHVIVGHSERRHFALDSDEMVNRKVRAALKAGFTVVLCVGEKEREDPKAIPEIVGKQVITALADVPLNQLSALMIAYEPIWAIGTGVADTPNDAMSASLYIRKVVGELYTSKAALALRILYGGSVNRENAAAFMHQSGIDGVLVGRASANKEDFSAIIKSVDIPKR